MQASNPPEPPPAPAPTPARAAAPVAARPPDGERHKTTVQLDRFTTASVPDGRDRRHWLVVGLAVVTGALVTAVSLILALR